VGVLGFGFVDLIVKSITANKPHLSSLPIFAFNNIQDGFWRDRRRGLHVHPDDDVFASKDQRRSDATAFDPGIRTDDLTFSRDLGVNIEAARLMRKAPAFAQELFAAGDELAGCAKMKEFTLGQKAQGEGDFRERAVDLPEMVFG